MSLRRHILRAVGLLTAVSMVFGAFAGSAVAKKVSKKSKVRAQLLRQVKKNPRVVLRKSFLRKAGLVHFVLPVTVRLRGSNNTTPVSPVFDDVNPNIAFIDLGSSLGKRQASLGGSLPAEVEFNDQFDGGALGNVRINLEPGGQGLTTTSIPLLWNANTSTLGANHQWWGPAFDGSGYINPQTATNTNNEYNDGCGGFTGNSNLATPITAIGAANSIAALTFPGIPYFNPTANPPSAVDPTGSLGNALAFQVLLGAGSYTAASTFVAGFVPEIPGVDSLTSLKVSGQTTNFSGLESDVRDNVGTNPDPFPTTDDPNFDPLNSATGPNVLDTVLRTAPITLKIAAAGTQVTQTDDTLGVDGSQNIVLGRSGGQANLFGNIPGKNTAIDVTVSLEGKINTILRAVDTDNSGLIAGGEFPPAAFECRQAYTGGVQNYFPGVRLKGNLQISPAITKDGKLRIAKAQLSSEQKTHFAVAACLYPHVLYAGEANSSDTTTPSVPNLPINELTRHPVPASSVNCKDTPTEVVRTAGLGAQNLTVLTDGLGTGYTTNADGSRVSVAALLDVQNVAADILIGKNQG